MNKDSNKRTVRIFDAKTGAARMSEPVPVQAGREGNDRTPMESAAPPVASAAPAVKPGPLAAGLSGYAPAEEGVLAAAQSPATPSRPEAELPLSASEGQPAEAPGAAHATKAPKAEIETLAQFIEYAYGRKGKPLSLKPKVERTLAQSPRLSEAEQGRLLELSKADVLLAVPRQLLLLSRDIAGSPGLRDAVSSFALSVMLRHPAFEDAGVQAAVRNLPEGLSAKEALTRLMGFNPAPGENAETLKAAELQTLRHNAAQLFVTWLAVNRGLVFEELASLLFQAIWSPAVKALPDDNARLRALTEVEHAAGVGLACQRFRQQAIEARAQQEQAQTEAAGLRERLATMEAQLSAAVAQRDGLQAELTALADSARTELESTRRQHGVERTHLHHELEQLRGRLVKRLTDSVDMLEVGLSALRKDEPRVPVMVERAEHVVDALRAEIRDLREE